MRQIMYIGPDIKGIVRKNEIFTYAPREIIILAGRVYGPAMELFVPMDRIVEKKQEINRPGSTLALIYQITENSVRR